MVNKLFCTFVVKVDLDYFLDKLIDTYSIINDKIYVLDLVENSLEVICTYNLESANINYIPDNTILVHRKKESNTLYTINALNALIVKLNGKSDNNYQVNWYNYKNQLLLTPQNELKIYNTKLNKIVEL